MADKSLRLKSSTGQYDVVVAISEEMLNVQLEEYYKRVKKFQNIEATLDNSILKADLNAPFVKIPAENGKIEIYYHVSFQKAALKLPSSNAYTLDGSVLAFKVDIDLQNANQSDLPHLQELLNVPDEFSVQRLMLDFGLAETSKFDPSHSNIKQTPLPVSRDDVPGALQKLVAGWLVYHSEVESSLNKMIGSLKGPNGSVKFPLLYYAMPPTKGQVGKAGMYQPTAVTHQLYPFQRPSGDQFKQTTRNSLLYLETTNKSGKLPQPSTFPPSNGVLLTADGDPNTQIKGSLSIASSIFFDTYLIPLLRPVIKQAELDCISAAPTNGAGGGRQYEWHYRFGDNEKHRDWNDSYFLMQRQQGKDEIYDGSGWFNNRVDGMDNYKGWRWLGGVDEVGNVGEGVKKGAKLTGRSIANLKYEAGTNKAVITGWSTMELHLRSSDDWEKRSTQIATTGKWNLELHLESISNGALAIRLNYPDNMTFKDWRSRNLDVQNIDPSNVFNEFHDNFKKSMVGVKGYVKELEGKLKQECFVVPGNGYFFMKNPVFSENGDLLVELGYKGIPPNEKRPQQVSSLAASPPVNVPAVINATVAPTTLTALVTA